MEHTTHTADPIAPCPYQLVSNIDTVRTTPSVQSKNVSRFRRSQAKKEKNPPVFIPQQAEHRDIGNIQPTLDRTLGVVCGYCWYIRKHSC